MKLLVLALALCGCWHFNASEEPPPEPRAPSHMRRPQAADAAVADAAVLDAGLADAAAGVRAFPLSPPPPCVRGRVIAVRVVGSDLELTVAGGANRGVTATWTATLGRAQRPARIVGVAPSVTIVATGATLDQIKSDSIATLCP